MFSQANIMTHSAVSNPVAACFPSSMFTPMDVYCAKNITFIYNYDESHEQSFIAYKNDVVHSK